MTGNCLGGGLAERLENDSRVIFEVGRALLPEGGCAGGWETNALFVIGRKDDWQFGLIGAANDFRYAFKVAGGWLSSTLRGRRTAFIFQR